MVIGEEIIEKKIVFITQVQPENFNLKNEKNILNR